MKPGDDETEEWQRRWRAPLVVLALVLLAMFVAAVAGLVILRGERAHAIAATAVVSSTVDRLPIGSSTQSLTVDGLARSYIIYRPAGLSGRVPLVVMLHGGYGSAAEAERA